MSGQLTNGQIMDLVAEGTRRAGILAHWERRAEGEDPGHRVCKAVESHRAALEDWRAQPAEGGGGMPSPPEPLPVKHYTTPMDDERVRLIIRDELWRAGLAGSPNTSDDHAEGGGA